MIFNSSGYPRIPKSFLFLSSIGILSVSLFSIQKEKTTKPDIISNFKNLFLSRFCPPLSSSSLLSSSSVIHLEKMIVPSDKDALPSSAKTISVSIQQTFKGTETSHHGKGKFINPWPSFKEHGLTDVFPMLFEFIRKQPKIPSEEHLVPVKTPNFQLINELNNNSKQDSHKPFGLTWLGHAAMLLSSPNLNVLFDPCFSNRCSPVQFAGPKRFRPVPFDLNQLPEINGVVISHNHYDHLDLNTIKKLAKPHTWFFVPMGNKKWFNNIGINNVIECDWWDEYEIKVEKEGGCKSSCRIACTPCQHFTGRGFFDRFKTLWSSWVVIVQDKKFFFGGDTGYRTVPEGNHTDLSKFPHCPAFKEIGTKYGPFDLSAIPIGAYSPRWFMSPIHCAPEDSVDLHLDIQSKKSVGMHWGTFILTTEPIDEPPKRLLQVLKSKNMDPDVFQVMDIGDTILF